MKLLNTKDSDVALLSKDASSYDAVLNGRCQTERRHSMSRPSCSVEQYKLSESTFYLRKEIPKSRWHPLWLVAVMTEEHMGCEGLTASCTFTLGVGVLDCIIVTN